MYYYTLLGAICLALASPTLAQDQQCNTGPIQCCVSLQDSNAPQATQLMGLLGVKAAGTSGKVGVTCTPISVIGVSGGSCQAQPVCCDNNSFNGIISIGCTPANINL